MRYEPGDHPDLDGWSDNTAINDCIRQRPYVERLRRAHWLFRRTLEAIERDAEMAGGLAMRTLAKAIKEWRTDLPYMPDENDAYGLTEIMDDVRHMQPCVYDVENCEEQRIPLKELARIVHAEMLETKIAEGAE